MKSFHFKNFSVDQDAKVFRVGTDAVLLGALSDCSAPKQILEIGCGCGIVSLMLAQRYEEAKILAIDIDENAVALTDVNFKNSPYFERLEGANVDFNFFETDQTFDLIVCNPPYFEKNDSEKDVLARQKVALEFENLVKNAAKILRKSGIFSVIIPAENFEKFRELSVLNMLFLKKKIEIFGIEGGLLKRVILEFGKENFATQIIQFTIEKSPRKFSDQYLEATKDFHLFKK